MADARGHYNLGAAPAFAQFQQLSLSINDPIGVANATARAMKLAELAALTPPIIPSAAAPLWFWRTDAAPGFQLESTTDGVTFECRSSRRVVGATAGLVGGVLPAAATILEQSGRYPLSTNFNADTAIIFPVPFPAGVLSVHLQRYDFSALGPTLEILNTVQGLDRVNFRVYVPSTGAALVGANLEYTYIATGW